MRCQIKPVPEKVKTVCLILTMFPCSILVNAVHTVLALLALARAILSPLCEWVADQRQQYVDKHQSAK